jgi:hypothetical protein
MSLPVSCSDELYRLAESQQGFFSASQARHVGYSRQVQAYHVKNGDWTKKRRGIFRLRHFPRSAIPDGFYTTYLWSFNREGEPEGVFGYGTALYLHDLSTYVPHAFDLIVPKHFLRHSKPPGTTELHKRSLDPAQIKLVHRLPVTSVLQTVIDLLDTRLIDYDYIVDALDMGLRRMAITHKQIKEANLKPAQRDRLKAALERVTYELLDEI